MILTTDERLDLLIEAGRIINRANFDVISLHGKAGEPKTDTLRKRLDEAQFRLLDAQAKLPLDHQIWQLAQELLDLTDRMKQRPVGSIRVDD